jgi:hypothetical protein
LPKKHSLDSFEYYKALVAQVILPQRQRLEENKFNNTDPSCPQEYAVIDFDRTNALNDVAKLQSQRSLEAGIAVSVRKTRHY